MKKTLTALGTVLLASNAYAAGFHLREQSAAALGNAFAGATAGAENVSYSYYNAAALTRFEGNNFNIGGTYIAPKAQAQNVKNSRGQRGSDVNNIVHAAVAPNMTIAHQINDKAYVGVALNVPFGMITKYDQDWLGSDHGITSKVTAVTLTPMAAYKVTDKLSIGAGLQIQYTKARLTNTKTVSARGDKVGIAIEGDALDLGYQLGAMYEFTDKTRAGIGYRSQVKHKLTGDMTSEMALLNQDIHARLSTPDMLSFGVSHEINDKWSVMAEYQRVFWSSFRYLDIYGERTGLSRTNEKWRDTNFYALGASYQIDHQWKWRLGLAYDQSAVRLQHRTPRIPDTDRFWYSTGLNYQYNDKLSFDLAYTYIHAKKGHIDTILTGNEGRHVTADYSNSVQLFGLSLNYKF